MLQSHIIDSLKKEYLDYLRAECQKILVLRDMKILTFLYQTIFDKKYYNLTRVNGYSEIFLNYEIGRIILYPYENLLLQNTQTAITLIPAFVSFFIGQGLILHEFIKVEKENIWDYFLTGIAHKINDEPGLADEYIQRFLITLESESKQYLAIDIEKTLSSIGKYVNCKEMLKLLGLMFFQDCLMFVVNAKNVDNGYLQFLAEKKKKMILNTFEHLENQHHQEIEEQIEFYQMKVAISFLENNYSFSYINQNFDHLQAGMVIFTLIQLDYRQFQNYYSILSNETKSQLLNQIIAIKGNKDSFFYRLLLVGKCLSKLRHWEDAINIFNILLKQISSNPNKDQYRMYISFKLYKIYLFQNQTKGLLKKLIAIGQAMDSYREKKLDFFSTNYSKSIYHGCLFLQLLLSVYQNEIDKLKHVVIKISNINMNSDNRMEKRGFTLLQFEFIRLINQHGAVFRNKQGERQLDIILSEIQNICEERQNASPQKQGIFGLFRSQKFSKQNSYLINNYYQAVEEVLIMNVLLRHREIYILQYLNPKFYPTLRILLNYSDFYENSLKATIYYFLHDFEKSLEIAIKIKDFKLIGQIYEQQEKYQEAVECYKKVLSPSCFFNCSMLHRYLQDHHQAYEGFKKLEQSQNQYQLICSMYKDDIRRKQQYLELSEARSSIEDIEIKAETYKSSKSLNLTQSSRDRNRILEISNNQGEQARFQSDFSYQRQATEQVESFLETTDFEANPSSSQSDEMANQLVFEHYSSRFKFKLRGDIQFFYVNLVKDLTNSDSTLFQTLNDFVEKTQPYSVESNVLFDQGNDFTELIGKGGFGEVYKFEFKGKKYALKVIKIYYDGIGENVSMDAKIEIEKKLMEICILCDVSARNIKYAIKLLHIGFKFELQGYTRVYQIFLITEVYSKHQVMENWEVNQKLEYIFKLTRTLYSLQTELKILHLDLKPGNILVDEQRKNPVVIDFGLSKRFIVSILGESGMQACTYRYVDPDLMRNNFKSRKNDVYSFGVSVFQYITNELPYKELSDIQLIAQSQTFLEYHDKQIKAIENEFIRNLIYDCTQPIKDRITFLEVLFRLFLYLYPIKLQPVQQLITLLFNHCKEQEKLKKQANLHFSLLKQFVKRTNNFIAIISENITLEKQVFQSTYHNDITDIFCSLIQRVKQLTNWIKLNSVKGIRILIDFRISFNQIEKVCKQIEIELVTTAASPITIISKNEWKIRFLEIAKTLQDIHQQNICMLILPIEWRLEDNGQILLSNFAFSQDISIEIDNLYPLNYQLIDPNIEKHKKFDFSNDIYAFGQLLQNTMTPQLEEMDEQEQILVQQLITGCQSNERRLTLYEIIEILEQ